MEQSRAGGILLPLFSLPGPYGIGALGDEARQFVDWLSDARQGVWQLLPLNPPGEGNSPYMPLSSFAGSPYYIDLEDLARQGLLTPKELENARSPNMGRVDYSRLEATRLPLLRTAWRRARKREPAPPPPDFPWMEEYAAFSTRHFPEEAARREEADFHLFLQTTFFRQWLELRDYANRRGVRLMGDLPIYLSPHGAEMWGRPHLFRLANDGTPDPLAGVPPDAFSQEGQLWGNPLYAWENRREEVFAFWRERIAWCARLFDVVRIDHFRAFHSYWAVPAGAQTAQAGRWEPGPGLALLDCLHSAAPHLELIAEDLGDLGHEAQEFVRTCGLPGMRVLVFAFDPSEQSTHLPHHCPVNSVAYTSLHDTPTFLHWLAGGGGEADFAGRYLRLDEANDGPHWQAVRAVLACPSRLAILPVQDVLGLGAESRVNTPGTVGPHNWSWRLEEAFFQDSRTDHERLLRETLASGRAGPVPQDFHVPNRA